MIRADSSLRSVEPIMDKIVDCIEGRLADAMAQGTRPREVKSVRQRGRGGGGRGGGKGGRGEEGGRGGRNRKNEKSKKKGTKRPSDESPKRDRFTEAEIKEVRVSNPEGWFLSNKSIPPSEFRKLTSAEKEAMFAWREENPDRAVKAMRTETRQVASEKATVYELTEVQVAKLTTKPVGILKPAKSVVSTNTEDTVSILTESTPVPVSLKPTVQFGRNAHLATGEAPKE
jgi:hypothetical protein